MGLGLYILDANGLPVPTAIGRWGEWYETADRVVAKTVVGGAEVSTVFLGIDHGFGREGPPVLWETMIFGGPLDGYQARFRSRADAEAGHAEAVGLAAGQANNPDGGAGGEGTETAADA